MRHDCNRESLNEIIGYKLLFSFNDGIINEKHFNEIEKSLNEFTSKLVEEFPLERFCYGEKYKIVRNASNFIINDFSKMIDELKIIIN
jgi:dihydroneopterin aldolase